MPNQANTKLTNNGPNEDGDSDFWNLETKDENEQNTNDGVMSDHKDRPTLGTGEIIGGIIGLLIGLGCIIFILYSIRNSGLGKPHFIVTGGESSIAGKVGEDILKQELGTVKYRR